MILPVILRNLSSLNKWVSPPPNHQLMTSGLMYFDVACKVPICCRPDGFYQQCRKNNKRPTFTEQLLWAKLWAWCFVNIIANPHIILAEWSILYPLVRYENSAPSRLKCTSIIQSVILGSRPNWFPGLILSLSFSGRAFRTSINTHFDLWHLQK